MSLISPIKWDEVDLMVRWPSPELTVYQTVRFGRRSKSQDDFRRKRNHVEITSCYRSATENRIIPLHLPDKRFNDQRQQGTMDVRRGRGGRHSELSETSAELAGWIDRAPYKRDISSITRPGRQKFTRHSKRDDGSKISS